MTELAVRGLLMGHRLDEVGEVDADIVRIRDSSDPSGPVEDSLVLIESDDGSRGRYVSWINYFDLEYAVEHGRGAWRIVEPPRSVERDVDWCPYGWPGSDPVPTVGDGFITTSIG